MHTGLAAALAITLAAGVGAQQPPATKPPTTLQQDFDAAVALDTGKDTTAALAAWTALEARTKPGSRARAIMQARKADALFRLERYDEAAAAAQAGLAGLPVTDATLRNDLRQTWFLLGTIAANTLDYAGAAADYIKAGSYADTPSEKIGPLLALTEVQTFVDPTAAAATLARLEALVRSATVDANITALVARRRAVLLLNTGDLPGAKVAAMAAVKALGGLTKQTTGLDAQARSDAAIALILNNQADQAREYMAMTGAGRIPKGQFDPAAQMLPPVCGGEAGLKPSDVAVVEFSITPEGRVVYVSPIYAAGGGRVAMEFARAARSWAWLPEQMASVPAFFRSSVRVEMRCSTAFERPSIDAGSDAALEQWLTAKGVAVAADPDRNDVSVLPAQRAALATADAKSPTSLASLAVLYRLIGNSALPRDERVALTARGVAIAAANDAPALARLAFDLPYRESSVVDRWRRGTYRKLLTPMLTEPAYAADPQARATIRLKLADDATRDDNFALTVLRQIAADADLKKNDPLKVGALVRIASIEQRAGRIDVARASFASTGLTADQCAILDAPPRMLAAPGGEAFPMEARRWGFEGWTQVQFDIAANGRTADARTVLSYPPFIFSRAGSDFMTKARFAQTFRPDGALGCGGTTQRIKFLLPD